MIHPDKLIKQRVLANRLHLFGYNEIWCL